MPAKNSKKQYLENSYYHVYNRGVEKRKVFQDEQDYNVFLSYLREYLLPRNKDELLERLADPQIPSLERDKILKTLRLNNFYGEIQILAFSLMPNHFHFEIKQKSASAIDKFMNSLCSRYTTYFNRKYKRVGTLYQGVYKAVLIQTEEQLIHLSRYIHKQALAFQGEALEPQEAQPSSYGAYAGIKNIPWVNTEEILSYFSASNPVLSYQNFVAEEEDPHTLERIKIENEAFEAPGPPPGASKKQRRVEEVYA